MIDVKARDLTTKMLTCKHTLQNLLKKIDGITDNIAMSIQEKTAQIKIIREEITKVGTEIDNIKKEITLLKSYNIN